MARKTKLDSLIGELRKIPGCIEDRPLSPAVRHLVDQRKPLRWDDTPSNAEIEAMWNDPEFLAYCERVKRSRNPL